MSLFAPGKHTPVGRTFGDQLRQQWRGWAVQARAVLVIGANPLAEDGHVWQPIINSAAPVWFVGATTPGAAWLKAAVGRRFVHVAETFDTAISPIQRLLRAL